MREFFALLAISLSTFLVPKTITAETPAPPAVLLDTIDNAARNRLVRADALLETRQFTEAIDNVMRMMESAGDQLVQVEGSPLATRLGFATYVPVRQAGHHWLAGLKQRAPAALDEYRVRVDSLAARWVRAGKEAADEFLLQRVVDEFFMSRSGDDALLHLGELARQQGNYTLARNYWERIHSQLRYIPQGEDGGRDAYPWWLLEDVTSGEGLDAEPPAGNTSVAPVSSSNAASTSWLSYPDSDLPLPELLARLALVSVLEGSPARADHELNRLERMEAESRGVLAGRAAPHIDLLSELLRQSGGWQPQAETADWTTFAGTTRRAKRGFGSFDLGGRPIWKQILPRLDVTDTEAAARNVRIAEDDAGLLSIYPLVANELAIYAVGLRTSDIEAVRLKTGQVVFPRGSLQLERQVPHLPGAPTVPRLTATTFGSTLFALTLDRRGLPTRIAAIDLDAQRRLQFVIGLSGPQWLGNWIFESAPISDGESLFVPVRRIDQNRHQTHIVCFDLHAGEMRWRRLVCEAEADRDMTSGYISNLLTYDQGTLYYNSNFGAVAAIRASDGFPRWVTRYPRATLLDRHPDRNELYRYRDLTPCMVHHDRLFVAPRDCERVFALDAITGSLLWAAPTGWAADAIHLLGIADEQLVLSGECLYWLDAQTGRTRGQFPATFHAAPGHARPSPRGYGRGLVTADEVCWPTRDAIYVFHHQTAKTESGWQPSLVRRIDLRSRGATGGHLLLHRGVLLVAGATHLFAFTETGHVRN